MRSYQYKNRDIENSKFNYRLANICYREIYYTDLLQKAVSAYSYADSVTDNNVRLALLNELNEIMKSKFKQLNAELTDDILNIILAHCHRGIFYYPIDIFVINDVVFAKEIVLDDLGEPHKIKTFMFDNNGKYYNTFESTYFSKAPQTLEELFENGRILTKQVCMTTTKFLSDSINKILFPILQCQAVRPLYELNTDTVFYSCEVLTHHEIDNIKIYLNKDLSYLAKSLINKMECEIKMVVQLGDDISMYNIHQTFINGEPVWEAILVAEPVWKLSEAAIAYENNITVPKRTLIEKK